MKILILMLLLAYRGRVAQTSGQAKAEGQAGGPKQTRKISITPTHIDDLTGTACG